MTGRHRGLAGTLGKKKVNTICVQETKTERYKLTEIWDVNNKLHSFSLCCAQGKQMKERELE